MKYLLLILTLILLTTCGPRTIETLQGIPGPAGLQGASGIDASGVTTVQFCLGYTTTYPTTFSEVGLLINGKVYGVLWNGQAALVELPPGYYSSTSTSAPCNFTINPDGTVSN